MKHELDRRWSKSDRDKVRSSKAQQAHERFRQLNNDLVSKPKLNVVPTAKEKQNGGS